MYINKALENLIEANFDKINLEANKDACESCEQLDELISQFESLRKDPEMFINTTVNKLKSQTDILREELKLKIDIRANKLIEDLDKYERNCKLQMETDQFKEYFNQIKQGVDCIRNNLDEWRTKLDYFDTQPKQLKKILNLIIYYNNKYIKYI